LPQNVVTIDPLTKSCSLESSTGGAGKYVQFDAAFGSAATTESVYENVGSVIVEAVLEGYNGTVFAYGQTGCGKSFTMRGFIERALEHLFEATSTASSETRYGRYPETVLFLIPDFMSNYVVMLILSINTLFIRH
jgi:kinesin family protein 3/17